MKSARILRSWPIAVLAIASSSTAAAQQLADVVMTDATNDQLVLFSDIDGSGVYDQPGEIIALYRDGSVAEQRDIQVRT
ncbi:MAG TPA: hypothetical protein VK843_08875, partial [Planctomycetota bacterium]|nr:hypothetical protein [Planctomycetota bacterium]